MGFESLESLGFTPDELEEIFEPLLDVAEHPDFEAVSNASGVTAAAAYVVGKNCMESLAVDGEEDWIEQLIKYGYSLLSSERKAAIAESGL